VMITVSCRHVVHVRLHTKLGIVCLEVFWSVVHCVEDRVDRDALEIVEDYLSLRLVYLSLAVRSQSVREV
jgi:hypothetical protein